MNFSSQTSEEYLNTKSLAVGCLVEMKNEIDKKLNQVETCECKTTSCVCSQIVSSGIQIAVNLPKLKTGGNTTEEASKDGWTISEGHSVSADPDERLMSGNITMESKDQNNAVSASLSNVTVSSPIKELCYKLEHAFVILFEVYRFDGDLGQKYDSWVDGTRIKDFFEGRTRYTVTPFCNPTADLMHDTCLQVAENKDLENHDGLIVVITTHGDKDGIYGSDKKRIKVEQIVEAFRNDNCKYLIGKPKLFFVEACRGSGIDYGVSPVVGTDLCPDTVFLEESKTSLTIPSDSDILVAYSTTFGNQSYGYVKEFGGKIPMAGTGTWFITILIETLGQYGDTEDLATMLTRVNRDMSCMGDKYKRKQISSHVNLLRHQVYFDIKKGMEVDACGKAVIT